MTTNIRLLGDSFTHIFNGHDIHQRRSDGYVCITDMARAAGEKHKDVKYYNRSARARNFKVALLYFLGKSGLGEQKVSSLFYIN